MQYALRLAHGSIVLTHEDDASWPVMDSKGGHGALGLLGEAPLPSAVTRCKGPRVTSTGPGSEAHAVLPCPKTLTLDQRATRRRGWKRERSRNPESALVYYKAAQGEIQALR